MPTTNSDADDDNDTQAMQCEMPMRKIEMRCVVSHEMERSSSDDNDVDDNNNNEKEIILNSVMRTKDKIHESVMNRSERDRSSASVIIMI